RQDAVGDATYEECKDLDLGDFVWARGRLMRTRTGELSVQADELVLLTKSIRPLPDKFHGLSDVEARFRQRYVDFVITPESRKAMQIRSQVIRLIREFFHANDYIEVETPVLHSTPGGAAARPFETHHNALDLELFLRIAPELYLKRMLVGGFGRVFELGRVFRNEGISRQHNPEFTMVEFYQAYATYEDLIELTEKLISSIAQEIHGSTVVPYGEHEIDFTPPWTRMTVAEAVAKHTGADLAALKSRETLEALGARYGIENLKSLSDAKLLMEVFDIACESKLIQPTFITHYPTEISPLSRVNEQDPSVVDRFELFVSGRELANAFSELNDPVDQHARFEAQLQARADGDEEAHPMDSDYVRALEYGMPPAAGQGIGVDRLVMVMANAPNIREIIAFPLMRPQSEGSRE
ncbi:MAG: lysine--tRNA ligase, partial [Myxococcales bacterium]|nr:lysine--tRNA ligase [Myxococcales bacterium]